MLGRNTHFTIALHAVIAMALNPDDALRSEHLAESVGTNPAFLRSVLSKLREAGIIATKRGAGGGSTLAGAASSFTLLDVYKAVGGAFELAQHGVTPDSKCYVNAALCDVFRDLSQRLEAAVSHELADLSVADVAAQVAQRADA